MLRALLPTLRLEVLCAASAFANLVYLQAILILLSHQKVKSSTHHNLLSNEIIESNSRLTEFYDDYIDSYGANEAAAPLPSVNQSAGSDRVGVWARSSANPNYPSIARTGSRSAPNSQYAPSSYGGGPGGGGSLRRKVTRRNNPRATSRNQSTYEEEEEGYVSGEYDDGPLELTMIRIKVACQTLHTNIPPLMSS